ncbi:copper amine oxidase N-terminal domain-containing protein [Candidatus Cryosericum septentrionale]|uniref:Copper amine oxidase N-terminal domain-containing protein n=2 Tax=Candidatus Cryosericum septentrionale TaxID=2290913 RepID=A0A398DZM2_9BACT|nr:copper amine oxidase N-terminal domain-containing protein [Candidatus Cryosericum septentrionale]
MNTGLTNRRIRSLAIDPLTPTTLYAITGLDVFRYGVVSASKSVIQLKIGSRTMYVDGSPVALEAAPIILNSRTLLPIRAIVEATGGTIAWEASTRKVTIVRKDKTLELWIGKNVATLNGKSVNIDTDSRVVPIIRSGRTLLPLRFVTEALALDVQWNATTQAITITYTP